jgi:signal transduction histidine kinase
MAFLSQAIIHHYVNITIEDLEQQVKNERVKKEIGKDVVDNITKIESDFYKLATIANSNARKIVEEDILELILDIEHYFAILKAGGVFEKKVGLNLPDRNLLIEKIRYDAPKSKKFVLEIIDISPKLIEIKNRVDIFVDMLTKRDQFASNNQGDMLVIYAKKIKLFLKQTTPIFSRLVENANRLYYDSVVKQNKIETELLLQEDRYYKLSMGMTALLALLTVVAGVFISKQITKTTRLIKAKEEFAQDILDSQANIITVNDTKKIINVSGGFFDFFDKYKTLDEFKEEHSCICELFEKEDGFVYDFDDQNWVEYIMQHQESTHKVKIYKNSKAHIFNINATESKKHSTIIVSMVDITDLENAKTEAEMASKHKSTFLANMSHELRTPLNSIIGFSQVLTYNKLLDDKSKGYVEKILISGRNLLTLVNTILDFSKIEAGKMEGDLKLISLGGLFMESSVIVEANLKNKNMTIDFDSNINDIEIYGDGQLIKQVMINLLSNAIKFSPKDSKVVVRHFFDAENNCDKIEIMDQGVGISIQDQAKLFNAFEQVDSSKKGFIEGTGLGLALCKKIVEDVHKGNIGVESQEGHGSTFWFTLPKDEL